MPVEIILEYPEGAAGNDRTRVIVAIVRDISERLDAQAERVRLRLFEDRERIGHDLHDLVIQRLFGAGLGLQALVARPLPPDVTERIEHTIDEMDDAIRELRSTIFRLNMDDEERLSVSDRITAVVEPFESRLGFRPSLTLTGDVDTIPLVVVEQLLPSLNESLSNVMRHAQARSVSVRVSHADGRVVADVIDDGVGLGSDGHSPLGHGLANVRSRANRLRGTATMADRAEGGGTQVRWSVPSG